MPDGETEIATTADNQQRSSVWSWLLNPWLLMAGALILPLCYIGADVWIQQRYSRVIEELELTDDVLVIADWRRRWWILEQIEDYLPESMLCQLNEVDLCFYATPTNRQIELLHRTPKLSRFRLKVASGLSDETLLELLETKLVRELAFSEPRILSAQHYAALARNADLVVLQGLKGPFDRVASDALAQLERLRYLELDGPLLDSAPTSGFSRLRELTLLRWHNSGLTDDQFANLKLCQNLKSLSLSATQLTAKSWPLLRLTQLTALKLESPHIDDQVIESAIRIPELDILHLSGGRITDRGLETLLANKTLSSLLLSDGSQITSEWMVKLAQQPFKMLSIQNSPATDETIEHLKSNDSLTHLGLAGSKITNRSLQTLNRLSLSSLDLRNTSISDEGLDHFSFRPSRCGVRRIHLGGTRVTAEGVQALRSRTRGNRIDAFGMDGEETLDDDAWTRAIEENFR